ncbi:MAG: PAS domain S-box protein [Chloroflexi bacterium]|nr:PAS domain S-box protein [Chloroflexota bacterium]OJV96346.1 MAG: hypothetical protein BGO39_01135 [Chloroflexi bacterium 54-19]
MSKKNSSTNPPYYNKDIPNPRLEAGLQLLESVDAALFFIDRNWCFSYINTEGENVVNYTRDELVGQNLWQKFPHLVDSVTGNAYRQAMENHMTFKIEEFYEPLHKWYEIHINPGEGGLAVYLRDITIRKKFEAELKESEARYYFLSNAATEGILVRDAERILDANQALADMFGYSLEELIGMPTLDLVTAETRQQIIGRMQQVGTNPALTMPASSRGFDGIYEGVALRKDGTTFAMEVRGRFVEFNSRMVRVMIIQDVQERKDAEEKLRESEQRFRALSEAGFEGIMIISGVRVLEANQAMADMFGYSLEEFKGIELSRLVTPEVFRTAMERIATGTNDGSPYESTGIHKNGEPIPVEIRVRLTEYRGQTVRVAAFRDLRERKAAEALLKKTQVQLQQAQRMESIGLLAGGIAHDFNNLLTAIIGYSELASYYLEPGDAIENDLDEIKKAAERAANLTRQLLAFSRQQILQPKLVNLNVQVADMDRLLQRLLGEDLELVTLMDPELGLVLVDPGQFEQVIMNLAVNARDAMPAGGKLTIETANVELDATYQSQQHLEVKSGHYVMLAVSDNGIGMSEETLTRIFDPFYTTKEVGKGTGLGLSTVYGIVNQSGGYIFVYSKPGIGTTFKVYIPRFISEPEKIKGMSMSEDELTRQKDSLQGKETILVVEDDGAVRNLIIRSLQGYGYHLLQASNGLEALALIDNFKEPIDLILTDIIMPQLGGRAFVEELQQKGINPKIMYMSGYTDRAVSRHNIVQNFQDMLQKPFAPKNLVIKVREILDRN